MTSRSDLADPSLEAPTLRDIDYLERRIQALEDRLDALDRRDP